MGGLVWATVYMVVSLTGMRNTGKDQILGEDLEFLFGHVIFEISMKHLGEAISRQLDK